MSVTIAGKTLEERRDTMLGELLNTCSSDRTREIVAHHLAVCYEEVERWRQVNRRRFITAISYSFPDCRKDDKGFTVEAGRRYTCNLCGASADTGKGETLVHELDCPIKE